MPGWSVPGGRSFLKLLHRRNGPSTLPTLEAEINRTADGRVSVAIKRWADRAEVETLKSNKAHKKYRILVEVDGELSADEFANALKSLKGVTIQQRTPERVAHRRADKIRERKVLDIEFVGEQDGKFIVEVLGEAGLYIKELVSGDSGQNRPKSCRDPEQKGSRHQPRRHAGGRSKGGRINNGTSQWSTKEDTV